MSSLSRRPLVPFAALVAAGALTASGAFAQSGPSPKGSAAGSAAPIASASAGPVVSGVASVSASAAASGASSVAAGPLRVDRVVARFTSPETGGTSKPQFVFERELAFEARIEALAGKDKPPAKGYSPRHARAALDRHVAETLLAALPIQPAPTEAELTKRTARARQKLSDRVGGQAELDKAAAAEGITAREVDELLRRQAKASFYLDRMVAPMLTPSEAELREALARQQTPFAGEPFERVAGELATWLLGERLKQAVDAYLQSARARVQVTLIGG